MTLSTTSLNVSEGGNQSYTVVLSSKPTATVTVAVAPSGTHDSDLSLSVGTSLTFATDKWDTPQPVTLTAAADDTDVANGTAEFVLTATGGDYAGKTATLTATEADDDAILTLSAISLDVTEGSAAAYTVELATQPTGSVTVAVARSGSGTHDGDLSVSSGASLTFETDDWNTAQTVSLTAAADDDAVNGVAEFTHTASEGGYGNVTATLTATEEDSDTAGLTLSATSVSVLEGSTAEYTVKLATRPSATVKVTAERSSSGSPDTDLKVKGTSDRKVLTFTTENWNSVQTVTLTAVEDDDALVGSAVIDHTVSGGDYGTVSATVGATESDDDSAALTLSATFSVGSGGVDG